MSTAAIAGAAPGAEAPRVPAPLALRPAHEAFAVAAACAVLALLGGLEAARQTYPYFDDVTYLTLGHEVRALGGPLGLLRALFAGEWAEANRHPLYLALLGLVAGPGAGYHRAAQALTLGLGVLALLASWWVARRHLGPAPAAVLALLLASSRTFVACSAREGCEPLLVVTWCFAVSAVLDGLDPGRGRPAWAFARAGAWSALAYLTKGTGMFLPVSLALAFLATERLRAVRDARAWAYGAAFFAVSSPLLVRNVRRFGAPFYNFNLPTLWQDRLPDFAEMYAPQAKALLPHGFLDYVSHLTPGALAHRVAVGLGETTFLAAEAHAPAGGAPGSALHVAAVVAGAAVVIVALRAIWRGPRGFGRTFLLIHLAWSYFFIFVFSVNGGNTRYFLPLAAAVLGPAFAARVVEGARAAGGLARSRLAARTGIVAAAGVAAALLLPPPALRAPGMAEVRAWLAARLRPGETYAIDARTHLQPQWMAPRARQLIVSASWHERPVEPGVLLEVLRRERVRYVLLDGASTAHLARPGDPAGRRYLFYDLLPLEPDGSLPLHGFPPGLTPAYVDPASPRRWVVLEADWGRAAAPPGPATER